MALASGRKAPVEVFEGLVCACPKLLFVHVLWGSCTSIARNKSDTLEPATHLTGFMQPACIRHTDLPGTSRLFADFAYHFDRVAKFYQHDPYDPESFARAAAQVQYPDERRAAMAAALRAQNGVSESLKRFAQPGTLAVVTGQQVGLFSGPAYTIYKAITAARMARLLTERGIPAVPVFWLATEDHDFVEVNHAWVFGAADEPAAVRVNAPSEFAAKPGPVGRIAIADPPLQELRAALAGLPFTDEVMGIVETAYAPGATMGSGFRALLKTLLAKLDLLYLDPLDPAVRKSARRFWFRRSTRCPS